MFETHGGVAVTAVAAASAVAVVVFIRAVATYIYPIHINRE